MKMRRHPTLPDAIAAISLVVIGVFLTLFVPKDVGDSGIDTKAVVLVLVACTVAVTYSLWIVHGVSQVRKSLDQALKQTQEVVDELRHARTFFQNGTPAGLISVEAAAGIERDAPPGSTIVVVNPSSEIEGDLKLDDGQNFARLVRVNTARDVHYIYLVPRTNSPLKKQLDALLNLSEEQGKRVTILEYPRTKQYGGEATLVSKAMTFCTLAIYRADEAERARTIVVAPGFERGYAIELSQSQSMAICRDINSYIHYLRKR